MLPYTIAVIVIFGILVQFVVAKKRHAQDYSEYLKPILEEKDLQLISSVFPGWFNIGPFPKIETEFGRPQSKVSFLGRGEFCQYRIVTVSDSKGLEYRLWALLDFEIFRLRHIRWRVEKDAVIPKQFDLIVENS